MSDENKATAQIKPQKQVSAIWIIPILALAMGAWMLFQYINSTGPEITLKLPTAEGIEVGKTETYIITATNQGSETGKDVTIKVTLEDAAEYVNSDGSDSKGTVAGKVINFAPVDIAVGGKKSWKVVVKAVKAGDIRFAVQMTEAQLTRPVNETEATNFFE